MTFFSGNFSPVRVTVWHRDSPSAMQSQDATVELGVKAKLKKAYWAGVRAFIRMMLALAAKRGICSGTSCLQCVPNWL